MQLAQGQQRCHPICRNRFHRYGTCGRFCGGLAGCTCWSGGGQPFHDSLDTIGSNAYDLARLGRSVTLYLWSGWDGRWISRYSRPMFMEFI